MGISLAHSKMEQELQGDGGNGGTSTTSVTDVVITLDGSTFIWFIRWYNAFDRYL